MFHSAQLVAGFIVFIFFLYFFHRKRCCKDPLFIDWPLLGMVPPLLSNLCKVHDYATLALQRQEGTGNFIGPWFAQMNCLITCDPMNVHYMLSKNFTNFVKGPEFRKIFKAFGEGVLTADSDTWKQQRMILHSSFKTKRFMKFREKIVRKKVESCLIPLLDHVERQGVEVDMQDVLNRFNFDTICSIVLGFDPKSLTLDFQEVACMRAFNEVGEFIFYRHVVPKSIWKIQRWLKIEAMKKRAEAFEMFDRFLRESISSKRENLSQNNEVNTEEDDDLITTLMRDEEGKESLEDYDKFLRDTAFTLFVAGRDTVSSTLAWFFWLVSKNPNVEEKILQEMKGKKEVKDQVYLHGALCEALRLYPPLPVVRRQATKRDLLPSGHEVAPRTVVMISLYAMGRYEEIWGKDCLEFKPERWISEKGGVIHIPSYKFISFTAGPRTCLGKDLSFVQMKIIASAILWKYQIHVVQDHPVSPAHSILLQMRYGLKVRITKRHSSI